MFLSIIFSHIEKTNIFSGGVTAMLEHKKDLIVISIFLTNKSDIQNSAIYQRFSLKCFISQPLSLSEYRTIARYLLCTIFLAWSIIVHGTVPCSIKTYIKCQFEVFLSGILYLLTKDFQWVFPHSKYKV